MSKITEPVILDKTGKRIAEAIIGLGTNTESADISVAFDGTKATYDRVMRTWFINHGALTATPAELTELCNTWYTITRSGWTGGVEFSMPGTSPVSDGTKVGDNEGLVCVPSTSSEAGRDDYAGLPLFACKDCNWELDSETGEPIITQIDGITSGFVRNDPTVYVGVLQMAGYTYDIEKSTTYIRGYSDGVSVPAPAVPVPESVRLDETIRPWVVHSKYMAGISSGKLTCCAGVAPSARVISHNTLHTYAAANGAMYSGSTFADTGWLKLMGILKYGALDSDRFIPGCSEYNQTAWAQVAETDVNRVLVPSGTGANFIIGSSILIGAAIATSAPDRGNAAAYSLSGADGRVITSITAVTVDGTTYDAIYFDGDPITTVAAPSQIDGTVIQTWHWISGTCDSVLGNDGAPVLNSKYPAKLQGIEYMVGGWEVLADTIASWVIEDSKNVCLVYIVKQSSKQSTGITTDYVLIGRFTIPSGSNGWKYLRKETHNNGYFIPEDLAGSSSNGHRDGVYAYADGSTTGLKEWRCFGALDYGLAASGRSCANLASGLSAANWFIDGRLSPNGNRG